MCTNFKIKPAADGTVVVGRTMEFPDLIPWEVQVVAAGLTRTSAGVKNGIAWTPQCGILGMRRRMPQPVSSSSPRPCWAVQRPLPQESSSSLLQAPRRRSSR